MITVTRVFNYKILKEKPIERLVDFKNHQRLRVFYHKGTTCVTCGKTGTRLIKGEGRGGKHWDVYTDDLYPLTVDHIIPKSLGGNDDLGNLQPMCAGCNFKKGNGKPHKSNSGAFCPKGFVKCSTMENVNLLIGKTVWKRAVHNKSAKTRHKIYEAGTVLSFEIDPRSGRLSGIIEGKHGQPFDLRNLFIPENVFNQLVPVFELST
jgi:hypothetical protein